MLLVRYSRAILITLQNQQMQISVTALLLLVRTVSVLCFTCLFFVLMNITLPLSCLYTAILPFKWKFGH